MGFRCRFSPTKPIHWEGELNQGSEWGPSTLHLWNPVDLRWSDGDLMWFEWEKVFGNCKRGKNFSKNHFQVLNSSIHLWLWWIVMGTSMIFQSSGLFLRPKPVTLSDLLQLIHWSATCHHCWCDKTLQEGKLRSPLTAALSWPHSMLLHSGGSGCAKGTQAKNVWKTGGSLTKTAYLNGWKKPIQMIL